MAKFSKNIQRMIKELHDDEKIWNMHAINIIQKIFCVNVVRTSAACFLPHTVTTKMIAVPPTRRINARP